jgi:hypothetical protein
MKNTRCTGKGKYLKLCKRPVKRAKRCKQKGCNKVIYEHNKTGLCYVCNHRRLTKLRLEK